MTLELKDNALLGYKGQVTVKTVRDGKVIKTKTIHNAGTKLLFKFLANCIIGNYYDNERPLYVKLFNVSSGNVPAENNQSTIDYIILNDNNKSVASATNSWSAYLEFVVPKYSFVSSAYNTICLYSNKTKGHLDEYCAIITLDEPETISSDDNLIIGWELTIENVSTN